MKAQIYDATVWHGRFTPKSHQFTYNIMMVALDLANLEQQTYPHSMIRLNKAGFLSLRDRDHDTGSKDSILENIQTYIPPGVQHKPHRVTMITQLAHFGVSFNPISFFLVTAENTDDIYGVILEVHNTPWGERHFYPLFDLHSENGSLTTTFKKALHVSPFLDMDFNYAFCMTRNNNDLIFSLTTWKKTQKYLTARIQLKHQPMGKNALRNLFVRHLFSPQKTVAAIYWQALKLWLKGIPFYPHPHSSDKS